MTRSSAISGFYKLSPQERLKKVKEFAGLSEEETAVLASMGSLSLEAGDRMIENVVGGIALPLGIAVNFLVNGRDYLIPMALEEASVVAGASHAAKMAREGGGFQAGATRPVMIGQIQLVKVYDLLGARRSILEAKEEVLTRANQQSPTLTALGGGAIDLEARTLSTEVGEMLVVELMVDCRDAMGANAVNTMAEAVASLLERLTGGRALLRIISNLATKRMVKAQANFPVEVIGGEDVTEGIIAAHAFASADPHRCATHNKGVMNGIVAVGLATGQDTRALEAGAHAYAALGGKYRPLTRWVKSSDRHLTGILEMPMAVGIVGGATKVHPIAQVAVKILGVKTANELAEVMGAVGLAQNFAALRALVTEGIQAGHMRLHARSVAITAGAEGTLVDLIAELMVSQGRVSVSRAKELLEQHRTKTLRTNAGMH